MNCRLKPKKQLFLLVRNGTSAVQYTVRVDSLKAKATIGTVFIWAVFLNTASSKEGEVASWLALCVHVMGFYSTMGKLWDL